LNGGSFHKFLSAQVHTSIRGRDDPHLFWCERPVNRALGFPNRLRFDGRLARDHDTGNRSGPFPETALDALDNGIFDVPIFHHQPISASVTIKVLMPVHLCLDMQRLLGPDSAFVPCAASRHADAGILFEATS
jgi:hypothetical protein